MKLIIGYFLVFFSLLIILITYLPIIKNEVEYQLRQLDTNPTIKAVTPLSTDFGIIIPKLNINAAVIKNVDPFDSKIYQVALTKGVAHAKGSSFPGEPGETFIFAHSSVNFLEALKYNSIFYLLPKLELGDSITLYFKDKPFEYYVTDKKIIESDSTEFLFNDKTNDLVLMTCYPPGTNLKRFIIIAHPRQ